MSFTDEVWQDNRNLLTAIHEHPFVAGLGEGSLPRQVFDGYLTQDALYLADYARAMGMLAARATDPDDITFWGVGVQGAIVAERHLHAARRADQDGHAAEFTFNPFTGMGFAVFRFGDGQPLSFGALQNCFG